jgi:hypothetical protein
VLSAQAPSWLPPCAATWSSSPPSSLPGASMWPTPHCANWPAGWWPRPTWLPVRHHPDPHRGLQGVAGLPARHAGRTPGQEHPTPATADDQDLPRAPHRVGLARGPPAEPDPSTATSRPDPARCPSSSPTRTRPSSWLPPGPTVCPAIGWWSRCCPAPACGPPSSASWQPTPSPCGTGPTGCGSRSASCATTG